MFVYFAIFYYIMYYVRQQQVNSFSVAVMSLL